MDSDQVVIHKQAGKPALIAQARALGYGRPSSPLSADALRLAAAICDHESGCVVTTHYHMGAVPGIGWTPRPAYLLCPVVTFDPGQGESGYLARSSIAGLLPGLGKWSLKSPDWSTGLPLYALVLCMERGLWTELGAFSIGPNQIHLSAHVGPGGIWSSGSAFASWFYKNADNYNEVLKVALDYVARVINRPGLPPYKVGEQPTTTAQRLVGQTGGTVQTALRFLSELSI